VRGGRTAQRVAQLIILLRMLGGTHMLPGLIMVPTPCHRLHAVQSISIGPVATASLAPNWP
jgi:hypothetical protein